MTTTEIAVELARCLESLRREGSEEWWAMERCDYARQRNARFHFRVSDGFGPDMWTVQRTLRAEILADARDTKGFVKWEVEIAYRMLRARSTEPV